MPQGQPLKVAILQGNIDQYQKWDDAYEKYIKQRYEGLISHAIEKKVGLIVWPESAVPGWIPNDQQLMDWLTRLIRKSNTYHIVGAVSQREGKEFNSAFFFAPDGKILDTYDKRHLVPFGEYIPFGGVLKKWVPYLGELGTFDAGVGSKVFLLPLQGRGFMQIEPNVCYEAIFPFQTKADIIVNITNDAWYLKTGAPAQHFAANVFRTIENKTPVIRAANTGISAVIDAHGRVLVRSNLMEEGVFLGDVYSSSGSDHL
jgi:apolipoprotein N-acyltransferase